MTGTNPESDMSQPESVEVRKSARFNVWFLVPLGVFVGLALFMGLGLQHDPHEVPSPFIGKPAPSFRLPLLEGEGTFSPADYRGKVWMLNVWASWCVSCREEHPILLKYARLHQVPLVGLDYKDDPDAGRKWVDQYGNPYTLTAMDQDGRVGIDYGVYGVPETYVIDGNGVIRYKQIGPITEDVLQKTLLPLLEKLQK
ncbi:Periplasmic protein thiol:disulfide oxidoreductase DsbE [mine drainage metagenome]|jgi:cytochrome c biogenesis protein CcmG/thiol:disulfide interchange protein DsbE|uniref:Thiol:disulfide interchange protein CycY n=3 Tax=root TaxID=1 RepID=A0A149VX05_9PROT|nr:DsbE family thiol:disulfide interchange protein [Ferrovum myxofaciens]KXW57750.1 thiol:disulfide interchange protein CycY precursor [Ferrovum myxofaciens]